MDRDETASGELAAGHVDWQDPSTLRWVDKPAQVDAAFDRGEEFVGVAVIALALNYCDPDVVLPIVARALESQDQEVRRQGVVALAHVARLHRTVDRRCLGLLRDCPRGNEADDDLWSFVDHRELPLWLWRHHLGEWLIWLLRTGGVVERPSPATVGRGRTRDRSGGRRRDRTGDAHRSKRMRLE